MASSDRSKETRWAITETASTAEVCELAQSANWLRLLPMRAIWQVRSRSPARAGAVHVHAIASRSNTDGDTPAATGFSRRAACSARVTRAATKEMRSTTVKPAPGLGAGLAAPACWSDSGAERPPTAGSWGVGGVPMVVHGEKTRFRRCQPPESRRFSKVSSVVPERIGLRQQHLHRLPEGLDWGWLADAVEKEKLRSEQLAERLIRFGYTLSSIGGHGNTNKLFWSGPMRGKVLCSNSLCDRFTDRLNEAHSVDIATAWATPGAHLRALGTAAIQGVEVRAIVGTRGNATHPDALEQLSRITEDRLRIIPEGGRLFHPKLYLFRRHEDGIVKCQAWIGSANFTNAGFGGHSTANEEILLEVGPGERANALADWFEERWDHYRTDSPVSEQIRQYTEDWKRSPPHPQVRQIASGSVSHRRHLLGDAHRPLTLKGYRQALEECEDRLRDEGRKWEVLDPRGPSYIRVILGRRKLLLGAASWSRLDAASQKRLKGAVRGTDSDWWGLMGRVRSSHMGAVLEHQEQIQAALNRVVEARDVEFPDVAVDSMRELRTIRNVGYGTATLLLTLARPDRLLSLNGASGNGLGSLALENPPKSLSTLGKPKYYRELLLWLYDQPWYADGPPKDEELVRIWKFRAALVDSFVYEPT